MAQFGSASISIGDDLKTLTNVAALRNYLPRFVRDGDIVLTAGQTTPGDRNGGIYVWSEGNTDADDGINVVKPATSIASGRWVLAVGRGNGYQGERGPTGPKGDKGDGLDLALDMLPVNVKTLGATGNGTTDDTNAIKEAVAAAIRTGKDVYFPAGRYRVTSPIVVNNRSYATDLNGLTVFSKGTSLIGAGPLASVIMSEVANNFAIRFEGGNDTTDFRAQAFTKMTGLGLVYKSGTAASGVLVRASYSMAVQDCIITGFPQDGIWWYTEAGDQDAPVWPSMTDVYVHNCGRWGINARGLPDRNELSFLRLVHVWVQGCGNPTETFKATPNGDNEPQSGGMIWKGQSLNVQDCGFTINNVVQLFIPGGAGIANDFTVENTAFENSIGRQILITGCLGGTIRRCHFYNNDAYKAPVMFEAFPNYQIANICLEDIRVRATAANNPCIAFKNTKAFASETSRVSVKKVIWQSFGATGQTGFVGDWTFDTIPTTARFTTIENNAVLIPSPNGDNVALRQRWGGGSGVNFESGDFINYRLPEGGLAVDTRGIPNGTYYVYIRDNGNVVGLDVSGAAPLMSYGHLVHPDNQGFCYVGRCAIVATNILYGPAANWVNPTYTNGGWQWIDTNGKLMIKATTSFDIASLPTSDTDGVIVGTQIA